MSRVNSVPSPNAANPLPQDSPASLRSLDAVVGSGDRMGSGGAGNRRLISEAPPGSSYSPSRTGASTGKTPVPAVDVKPSGKAKDLGPPIYAVTVKYGAVESSNRTYGDGLQVGVGVKAPLNKDTSLTGAVSVGGYSGRLQNKAVDGTLVRASVGVNHNLPASGKTKWNVGATAGVEIDKRQGSPDATSFDVTASGGFSHPLQSRKTKIDLVGDASTKLVFGSTNQFRPKVSLGVKVSDGPWAATLSGAVEARVNLNGANQGKVAAVIPVVGLEASYKASDKVSVFGNVNYTLPTGLPASSGQFFGTTSNPGWSVGGGIRIEL